MIKEWIKSYNPTNKEESLNALREIMQEIAPAGLQRTNFFEKAAFYGGTALRIFYGLDRFSEDLDFSLIKADPDFSLDKYLHGVLAEFEAQGLKVTVQEKKKTTQSNIESAFLKSETLWKELILEGIIPQAGVDQRTQVKIKLEVDTLPPMGFETEDKLLIRPFSFYVRCFVPTDLFAGKMHALLYRKWKNNVKGRDWYDLEWYIKKRIPVNLEHFLVRAKDSGDWTSENITAQDLKNLLIDKIQQVNLDKVKEDISRFIPNPSVLDIWSVKYFLDLADQLIIKA